MTTARAVATTCAAFVLSQITAVAIHGFILAQDYAPFYGTLLRDFQWGPGWRALLLPVAHLCVISVLVWIYGRLPLEGSQALRGVKLGLIAWLAIGLTIATFVSRMPARSVILRMHTHH
jgi:hypothetical protein